MKPKKSKQLSIFPCQWCGEPLPEGRRDMKFHDPACRQAHKRWVDKMAVLSKQCHSALSELSGYLDNPQTSRRALVRLRNLASFATNIIDRYNNTSDV